MLMGAGLQGSGRLLSTNSIHSNVELVGHLNWYGFSTMIGGIDAYRWLKMAKDERGWCNAQLLVEVINISSQWLHVVVWGHGNERHVLAVY